MGKRDNAAFQNLLSVVRQVKDSNTDLEWILDRPIALMNFLPSRTWSFFRYSGSLTTPECHEIVTWTLFTDPLAISYTQVKPCNFIGLHFNGNVIVCYENSYGNFKHFWGESEMKQIFGLSNKSTIDKFSTKVDFQLANCHPGGRFLPLLCTMCCGGLGAF